jgi:hypothetical protein
MQTAITALLHDGDTITGVRYKVLTAPESCAPT